MILCFNVHKTEKYFYDPFWDSRNFPEEVSGWLKDLEEVRKSGIQLITYMMEDQSRRPEDVVIHKITMTQGRGSNAINSSD